MNDHAAIPADTSAFRDLFDDVDDLLKRVADVDSPELQKIRAKVRVAAVAAKSALGDSADQLRRRASQAAHTADDYVRDNPWQSLALVALLGAGIGFLARRGR
jgi:ElaB/YqjD/DUF883 family membrane-anchored ribosome-binding protein